jgi:hypothetical protein
VIRTQISLTSEQMKRAQRTAADRGISFAALVREALDRLLDESAADLRRRRAAEAVGGFRSGRHRISEQHDDVLAASSEW